MVSDTPAPLNGQRLIGQSRAVIAAMPMNNSPARNQLRQRLTIAWTVRSSCWFRTIVSRAKVKVAEEFELLAQNVAQQIAIINSKTTIDEVNS